MGTVTNRITQTLVPGSARDIAFKAIILWHGNRLSNKLNRHRTTVDVLSVLEVAVDLDYQHVLYGFCLLSFSESTSLIYSSLSLTLLKLSCIVHTLEQVGVVQGRLIVIVAHSTIPPFHHSIPLFHSTVPHSIESRLP